MGTLFSMEKSVTKLKDLGENSAVDHAYAGNTHFDFFWGPDGSTIKTNTTVTLNHTQKPDESLEDFKLRVLFSVYGRIKALQDAFPFDIEEAGLTMILGADD